MGRSRSGGGGCRTLPRVERCLACEADGERSDIARNGLVAHMRSASVEGLDPDYRRAML
jgi:hypothetical protein